MRCGALAVLTLAACAASSSPVPPGLPALPDVPAPSASAASACPDVPGAGTRLRSAYPGGYERVCYFTAGERTNMRARVAARRADWQRALRRAGDARRRLLWASARPYAAAAVAVAMIATLERDRVDLRALDDGELSRADGRYAALDEEFYRARFEVVP